MPAEWQAVSLRRQDQISSVGARLVTPATEPPKYQTEENCAAAIYTTGIPKFIAQPGVVGGVYRHIASEQKVRHRHRHERSLQNAPAKARWTGTGFERGRNPIEDGTDCGSHD